MQLIKLATKYIVFIASVLFMVLGIALQPACKPNPKHAADIAHEKAEGQKIVDKLQIYYQRHGQLSTKLGDVTSSPGAWKFIRLDDHSYILRKELGSFGAKIEYRFGVAHHGVDFVGWYFLEGSTSRKL